MRYLLACLIALALLTSAHADSQVPVGIDERLGKIIPMELTFKDEQGSDVRIGQLIDRPTVIALVYFGCRGVCPLLQAGLAEVSRKSALPSGSYNLISVSFDPTDTPTMAADAKKNYLAAIGAQFPPERWRFLTGSEDAIASLTRSVGFVYERAGKEFNHPAGLIVLSPDGKIVRYLYGVSFLPFDFKMAISEASAGRVGGVGARVLTYCYSYDTANRKYAFNILRVFGTISLMVVVALFIFLTLQGRKRGKDAPH